MNDVQRRIRRRRGTAGFSVIEVLVAIALLVVGIVAVLELFPPGFFAINGTINSTHAAQLAEDYFETLKDANLDMVGAILSQDNPTTDNTTAGANLATAQTPNMVMQQANPADMNVDSERMICGEAARVPTSISTVNHFASYAADFGPIDLTTSEPAPLAPTPTPQMPKAPVQQLLTPAPSWYNPYLAVCSAPWTATTGTAYGDSGVAGAGTSHSAAGVLAPPQDIPVLALQNDQPQYLVDYNQGELALPFERTMNSSGTGTGGYDQIVFFCVTGADNYQYFTVINWDNTSSGKTIYWDVDPISGLAEPIWFPASPGLNSWLKYDPTTGNVTSGNPPLPWNTGSAVAWRYFKNIGTGGTANSSLQTDYDPYECDLAIANYTGTNANPGIIGFNVNSASLLDSTGKPLGMFINYYTADWHIIHEDHTVTSQDVRLDLGSVLMHGEQIAPGLAHNSIFDVDYPAATSPDIDVINLDTGSRLQPNADYAVDNRLYSTGVITLTSNQYLNAHLRVYYRSQGDWSVDVIKSPAFYSPNPVVVNSGSAPANTLANAATYQIQSSGTFIFFPLTDVGKSVQVNGVHIVGSGGVRSVISDAGAYTIQPYNNDTMGYIDLSSSSTSDSAMAGQIGPLSGGEAIDSGLPVPIQRIVGASVTVRVVYYEGGQLRYHDFQSFLPPGQQI